MYYDPFCPFHKKKKEKSCTINFYLLLYDLTKKKNKTLKLKLKQLDKFQIKNTSIQITKGSTIWPRHDVPFSTECINDRFKTDILENQD